MTTELRVLTTIHGVCPHDCPDTCGLKITVDSETGRAVDLRGDSEHPFTRGFLCTKVSRYLERVYHDGRLLYPQRRVGPKGSGQFERVSWAEAIQTISAKLKSIASQYGPESILPYSYAGTMGKLQYGSLDRRFFHVLGASLLDRTICATAGSVGCDITLGTRAAIDPEAVVKSRFIVNWGSNTSVTNSHLWAIMHQARKAGAKIVTIDPHRSKTAAKSDQWIPIRPGTDGALALAVMHILFRDGLQDQDYLDQYCHGTELLRERVEEQYSPEKVSKITGLPVELIESFAREYGRSRELFGGPALIRLNYGLQRHGGGAMAVRTICCLPGITGDWRYPGGGALLSTSKMYPFNGAYLERPDLIPAGTRTINMTQLAEALNNDLPGPPVMALFVYNSNPAAIAPDQSRVLQGLLRDDLFTVVHEQFQTDTADYADILLPATTQLEHFDIHNSYGHLYVQVNQPAIKPLGEAKPNTEVFRLLAKEMGLADEIFQVSDHELARNAMINGGGQPYPMASAFDGIEFDDLLDGKPRRLNVPKDWAPFAQGGFGTPTGKLEFFSRREERQGRDPLPHYIPPHEDPQTKPDLASRYPLQMICPPNPSFLNSSFANLAAHQLAAGEPKIEIHPTDAAMRGIADRQMVRVFNDRGRFLARAMVGETVKRGVVVTFGIWWNKDTQDRVNCNTTTSTALTDQGGGATFFDNLVEVQAINAESL
jgi:anaerobic selenocysteine-containing dehydrogenase